MTNLPTWQTKLAAQFPTYEIWYLLNAARPGYDWYARPAGGGETFSAATPQQLRGALLRHASIQAKELGGSHG